MDQAVPLSLDAAMRARLAGDLDQLYGDRSGPVLGQLEARLADFARAHPELATGTRTLPQTPMLITYADTIREAGKTPLRALADWLDDGPGAVFDAVHLLPFFPWSSDDGFSVIDYRAVDPAVGGWPDITHLAGRHALMFDAVVNHVSAQSDWFARFRRNEPPYDRYFVTVPQGTDLSSVTRPRSLPLVTSVETRDGVRGVWTTFSPDQIDLNYANPEVLLAVIDVLLAYVAHGARFLRLDAISYAWKEIGTTCINLPGTHAIVRIVRTVLDAVAPEAVIITETNVPHDENIAYWGDGRNEAQAVYNFALPPLLLDACYHADTRTLGRWAEDLEVPGDDACFFNVTATHDGIGLRGAQAFLDEGRIAALVEGAKARGGFVSDRALADGGRAPYELNLTFFDAVTHPDRAPDDPLAIRAYLTVQAVALSLPGIPGVYIHNLFGSLSDHAAVEGRDMSLTEFKRLVNRHKFTRAEVDAFLYDEAGRERAIYDQYMRLLAVWKREPAFAPTAGHHVLHPDSRVLAIVRDDSVLALHNFSNDLVTIDLPDRWRQAKDLLSGETAGDARWHLSPHAMAWLKS